MSEQKRDVLLDVRHLQVYFPIKSGLLRKVVGHVHAVEDVSFTVEAGQTVAFAGHSGCGKSTIFNLLNKQYTPDGGEILLDDVSLSELDSDSARGHMALINQYPYLFNATIRVNLAYVKPDVTDEELVRVCQACCIHDDIMSLENGYDTMISEGGRDLSGGQRQRLAIARGLLCDARILLMDESTSALDAVTEHTIMENIKARKITTIIVAHRLSTVRDCDRIIVLSGGKIVEQGTHDELMRRQGSYYTLVSSQ